MLNVGEWMVSGTVRGFEGLGIGEVCGGLGRGMWGADPGRPVSIILESLP